MKVRRARIGDVATFVGGGTPSRKVGEYFGGSIPWVTPKDMKTWEIHGSQIYITEAGLLNSAARMVPPNSVLVVVRSGVLKHRLPIAITKVPVAVNQDMKALICSEDIDPGYAARFLKKQSSIILRWVRATTADNFSAERLKRLEIPLPPLPEQRRIAEILDKADALRARRRAALARFEELAQAIFLEMFGDPTTNPKGWRDCALLGDVADVASGVTIGRKLRDKRTREVPYLAVVNVQDRSLNLTAVKSTLATEREIQRYRLRGNDLLLTEGGDPDKLGRGALWAGQLPECIHQNHVFRVRLLSLEVTPLFLSWLVGSQRGKRYFFRSAKQTTGIASINMTQLRAFPLLVPPLALQEEFARRMRSVDRIRVVQHNALAEADDLFDSLQQRAFRGDL